MIVRRVLFTGPRRVGLSEDVQELRADGFSVSGQTVVSLISPGTELAALRNSQRRTSYPVPAGYAAVFEVADVGGDVTDIKLGQRVFCMGQHQSFQQLSRARPFPPAIVVPESLASDVAVFARFMAVSMATLATTRARPPAKVFVSGLGLIGNMAAQIFGAAGYETCAWDPVARRRELAASCGVRTVDVPLSEAKPQIGEATLVVECSGHEAAVLDCLGCLKRGGEVVLVARPWERKTDLPAQELLDKIFSSYATVRSGWEWQVPLGPEPLLAEDFRTHFRQFAGPPSSLEMLQASLRWLDEGRVSVDGLADIALPQDAPDVYARLDAGDHQHLTTLFQWHA